MVSMISSRRSWLLREPKPAWPSNRSWERSLGGADHSLDDSFYGHETPLEGANEIFATLLTTGKFTRWILWDAFRGLLKKRGRAGLAFSDPSPPAAQHAPRFADALLLPRLGAIIGKEKRHNVLSLFGCSFTVFGYEIFRKTNLYILLYVSEKN